MDTHLGNNGKSKAIYKGATEVVKIFYKNNLVYESKLWVVRNGVINETLFNNYFSFHSDGAGSGANNPRGTYTRNGVTISGNVTPASAQDSLSVFLTTKNTTKIPFIEIEDLTYNTQPLLNYGRYIGGNNLTYFLNWNTTQSAPTIDLTLKPLNWGSQGQMFFLQSGGLSNWYFNFTFKIKNLYF